MSSVVIVDSRVRGIETLLNGLSQDTHVILLDADSDGVEQIVRALSVFSDLDAIHMVSHGSAGTLYLGSTLLSLGNISDYQAQLAQIGATLSVDGDILLYGCYVGSGTTGQSFIENLSKYTGADVAASDDATGNPFLGGDWMLEATTGPIESVVPFDASAQINYVYWHTGSSVLKRL